jgi:hypothetical protein
MKFRTPDELRKRIRDLNNRIGRTRLIKRKYQQEIDEAFKELAIREYGMPGDSVSFYGPSRKILQGTICRFDPSIYDEKVICIVKVQGDFIPYETHISDPKSLINHDTV